MTDSAALDRKANRIVGTVLLVLGLVLLLPGLVMVGDVLFNDVRVIAVRPIGCSLVFGLPLTIFGLSKLLRPADHG